MIFSPNIYYQPFEVVYFKRNNSFTVYCNRGFIHAFFKPERPKVDVSGLVELVQESSEPFTLMDGEFLYINVTLSQLLLPSGWTIGVPVEASIDVGTEVPATSVDRPDNMYYEVCRAENNKIRQMICSDIWCGWIDESDSQSESSISASSSSSSQSESASASSSDSMSDALASSSSEESSIIV